MNARILLLSLSILFLVNCKKKKDPTEEVKPDVIVHRAIADSVLSSIKGFTPSPGIGNPCSEPIPKDSTAIFDLDLDNDQVVDFRISVSHTPYTGTEYCGHCPVYSQFISIKPLKSNCAVSNVQGGTNLVRGYKESESIMLSDSWSNSVTTCFVSGCSTIISLAGPYWGLKIDNKLGWIKVSWGGYSVKLSECAFNHTENKSILAGQKQ